MAQRLVRAKKKIRDAGIPYETPEPPLLYERIDGVLAVVYGVFTEGYAATTGSRLVDAELCGEAIRLGRLLDELLPNNPAVLGLLGARIERLRLPLPHPSWSGNIWERLSTAIARRPGVWAATEISVAVYSMAIVATVRLRAGRVMTFSGGAPGSRADSED